MRKLVLVLALFGCKDIKEKVAEEVVEKAIEAKTGTKVDVSEGSIEYEGPEGKGKIVTKDGKIEIESDEGHAVVEAEGDTATVKSAQGTV